MGVAVLMGARHVGTRNGGDWEWVTKLLVGTTSDNPEPFEPVRSPVSAPAVRHVKTRCPSSFPLGREQSTRWCSRRSSGQSHELPPTPTSCKASINEITDGHPRGLGLGRAPRHFGSIRPALYRSGTDSGAVHSQGWNQKWPGCTYDLFQIPPR